ncbi:peptidoglycan DD-metalloendopeptidase family protein [soil metagenome]
MSNSRLPLAAVAVLASLVLTTSAQGDTQAELDDVRQRIDQLSSQIESAEAAKTDAGRQVFAARSQLEDLVGQVQAAQAALLSTEAEIAAEEAELERVQRLMDHFESALAITRVQKSGTKETLSRQVVELYMNASTAGTRLFGFADAAEATVGFAYLDGAVGDSAQLFRQLSILETEEERQQTILDEQRVLREAILVDLDTKRRRQVEEVQRVDDLRAEAVAVAAEAERLVAAITADISSFEQHKQGLEADAAALEAELAARPATGEQPSGLLMRPVPGGVSSPYGYRIHPIFGTRRLHTGWDLRAATGEPIVAAESGVVVSAGARGGYGNAVVIDHGGGLATLYAHQSSVAVSAGQQVGRGQIVGYVGCTGYCTGPHLHFETLVGGRPVDPSPYMG